ncbi:MAG: hypothetical protein OEW52_04870 [Thermoleophilia bacterium]|nr:hypothetical protein [Thermoleophilia bacterium]MDH4340237.1 hypothetical protein [Thermoleophilia bacterium]MDH5280467.1 hypothetical protein [Thermoleophilia bacterium]
MTDSPVLVDVVIDFRSVAYHPLGDEVETFIRREEAERFIEEGRGDDPDHRTSRRPSDKAGTRDTATPGVTRISLP